MKNKEAILLIGGILIFVGLLVSAYFGYDFLASMYNKNNTDIQAETNENDNIQDSKPSIFNKKVKAADFTVYDEKLNEVKLSDYKGIPVVLNFWASWCPPCKEEMPGFNEISKKYSGDKIAILMINLTDGQRETMTQAKSFISENNYKMKVLFDNNMEATSKYNITAIPRTIFIDKDGYIAQDYSGSISEDILDGQIKLLLKD